MIFQGAHERPRLRCASAQLGQALKCELLLVEALFLEVSSPEGSSLWVPLYGVHRREWREPRQLLIAVPLIFCCTVSPNFCSLRRKHCGQAAW